MANLMQTIHTLASTLRIDELQGNTICFITSNGVIIGNPITVADDFQLEDTKDLPKLQYHLSIKNSKKNLDETKEDLNETILLEKVKYKVGNTIVNLEYLIVNLAQVVAFHITSVDASEEYLEGLILA